MFDDQKPQSTQGGQANNPAPENENSPKQNTSGPEDIFAGTDNPDAQPPRIEQHSSQEEKSAPQANKFKEAVASAKPEAEKFSAGKSAEAAGKPAPALHNKLRLSAKERGQKIFNYNYCRDFGFGRYFSRYDNIRLL